MGKYVNYTSSGNIGGSASAKCEALIEDGAVEITTPDKFMDNLVCVVDNGFFGAAAYAYSENEFRVFMDPYDGRPKRWFIWDKVQNYAF